MLHTSTIKAMPIPASFSPRRSCAPSLQELIKVVRISRNSLVDILRLLGRCENRAEPLGFKCIRARHLGNIISRAKA